MAKFDKDNQLSPDATEALEIIELSIDDLDLLARAFQLIEDVCEGNDNAEQVEPAFESEPISTVIH